jgi:hypothetical protein
MSTRPVARISAIVEDQTQDGEVKSTFVEIGVLWPSRGNAKVLTGTIQAVPPQWLTSSGPWRIIVQPTQKPDPGQGQEGQGQGARQRRRG